MSQVKSKARLELIEGGENTDTSWERSFPASQVDGYKWIVCVLDDLHAFAKENDLEMTAMQLRHAAGVVRADLGMRPAPADALAPASALH